MKQFKVTKHAIDRAVDRLGVAIEHARNHLVNMMQTAYYNGSTPHPDGRMRKIFDHHKSRTRIIVSDDGETIITVYKMPDVIAVSKVLRPVIDRELRKVSREVTRNTRALELKKAHLLVEYGEMAVNKARARNPQTQTIIQAKMDGKRSEIDELEVAVKREQDRLENFAKATEVFG